MSKITSLSTYVPFFSGMYKGILSLILGLILIFDPDKSAPKLTYIMGMFWAGSGIALLRHGPIGKMGKRLSILISAVAIVTGLLVVARYFLNAVFGLQFVANSVASIVLGAVILLTGISHLITEWKFGYISGRRILHTLLAIFEILLGLQLMLLPVVDDLYVRQTITVWALLGGILFVSTTIYEHLQRRQAKPAAGTNSPTGSTEDDGTPAISQENTQQSATGEKTS